MPRRTSWVFQCVRSRQGHDIDAPATAHRDLTPEKREGSTMTRMTPLLERNEQFARTYTPVPLGPADRAGARRHLPRPPGRPRDRPRTPARRRSRHPQRGGTRHPGRHRRHRLPRLPRRAAVRRAGPADRLFEVAVVHHTQCGTGFLADPDFRRQAAEATGVPEAALEASAVADPHTTVKDRRRAPARLAAALTEGERLRPRLRHRHRTRHHHSGRPVSLADGCMKSDG